MSTAIGTDAWTDFAEMSRTELLVIDGGTTTMSFQHEVRWNSAYYRLAQGL